MDSDNTTESLFLSLDNATKNDEHLFEESKQSFIYAVSFICLTLYVGGMAIATEKAHCVGWYFESKSITTVQRKFRNMFKKKKPSRNNILAWHEKFLEARSVLDKERSGRRRRSYETVQDIREAFARSP
ncbi:unnamed protein product [Larinioides sclopetarius]|uniref:DUF4817 domain-containing protein n=1 Tax=Larinioides sclopetarius TaxID=280406 RepID=A0AAV1Z036_9ARAC